MKYYFPFLLLALFLLGACTEASKEKKQDNTNQTVSTIAPQPIETLPSIPVSIMQTLFDKCDHVDYLFYESNFSMSMDSRSSIQQTLTHISESVPVLNKNCKSIGRVFYEIDGNTEIEAEIYYSNECQHFVFMKGNKRIYANSLTPDGVAHFKNVFQQASKMNK